MPENKQQRTPEPMRFQEIHPGTYPERVGFRPGVPMFPMEISFVMVNGGMGDYICWMKAVQWLMTDCTWLRGRLLGPTYFREIAEYFLKANPEWKYIDYSGLPITDQNMPFRGPLDLPRESLNATGAHLLTCGWVYFCNKEGPPPGWEGYVHFEQSDLDAILAGREDFKLPTEYAVVTTGLTTPSRKVPGHYWNYVIDHLIHRGLTPVFLGKAITETGNPKNVRTEFDPAVNISAGIDLRDRTSLMEAAAVMSRAKVVVGHDNGLLHLAGCTSVPIVFGYNLALPEHRRPIRPWLKDPKQLCYDVLLNPGELACFGCQSRTNFVLGYNFRNCFYDDNKCIDMLFDSDGARWIRAIDEALGFKE